MACVTVSFPSYRLVAPDGTKYDCDAAYSAEEQALNRYHSIRSEHRRGRIQIWDIQDSSYDDDNYKERLHTEKSISLRRLMGIVERNKRWREQTSQIA